MFQDARRSVDTNGSMVAAYTVIAKKAVSRDPKISQYERSQRIGLCRPAPSQAGSTSQGYAEHEASSGTS